MAIAGNYFFGVLFQGHSTGNFRYSEILGLDIPYHIIMPRNSYLCCWLVPLSN